MTRFSVLPTELEPTDRRERLHTFFTAVLTCARPRGLVGTNVPQLQEYDDLGRRAQM